MGGGNLANLNKKKGFTLIELLAVIVILAVIALITTPIVLGTIKTSKDEAFKLDVKSIVDSASLYQASHITENRVFDVSKKDDRNILGLKQDNYTGTIKIDTKGVKSVFVSNGEYCMYGNDIDLKYSSCKDLDKTIPEVSVTQTKKNGLTEITIDTYDNNDVSYIQLPNGEKVDTESRFVDGKDDSIKILVNQDMVSESGKNYLLPILKKYFNNVVFDSTTSIQDILDQNPNIVVADNYVWKVENPSLINRLYESGINLYTAGNDSANSLNILTESTAYILDGYNSIKMYDNEITSKIGNRLYVDNDNQYMVKFNMETETWYQATYNDIKYGTIGYWKNSSGTRWIHSQACNRYSEEIYKRIMYRLSGKKSTTYMVDKSGTYEFKVYDIYGNMNVVKVVVE